MPPQERTTRQSAQDQLREYRRVTANAVGEIRSAQIRDTYAALSLEELIDQHIEKLEGTSDPLRRSRKSRINKVYEDFRNNIEAMRATPPEMFRRHDPDRDANTDPDGE